MMNPDPPKPKLLTATRLKAVGQGILLWVVMWLGISLVRQNFSMEYLLLLPLALLKLSSPPQETGIWFYIGPFFCIFTLPWLLTARFRMAIREFYLLAFSWSATLALLSEPVGSAVKAAAVAGVSLWVFWAVRRTFRALRAEREAEQTNASREP